MKIGAPIGIDRLQKTYRSFTAVDSISLNVAAGEFVTLLGASGSGKTTTLMAVAGFVTQDSGSIFIGDKEISRLTPEARGLGVVFQSYALFPNYDVFENVAFSLRLRRVAEAEVRRKVTQALEMVDLAPLAERRIAQLSGGQQQRVALARAIVFAPPVLLMDEPLGALDRSLREQLQGEIKRIQIELGVTVLYVTHDQEEALAMSDRIAIMRDGRIAQIGSPDEVYGRPTSQFAAGFLGESNFVKVRFVSRAADILLICTIGDIPQMLRAVLADGSQPESDLIGMIRPESIRIGVPGNGESNRVAGSIRRRQFLGPSVRLTVDCGFGELIVRLSRLDYSAAMETGTSVQLVWRPQDMILFPDEVRAKGDRGW